ncbi:MAG: hypothetical protein K1X36_14505 [Pyrinomonadaceae bacterium]|nr:hypothetical protein [Pyrinomonadaceae bacterium]
MFPALKRHKIYKKLNWLNELPVEEAEYVLRECGGSDEWARRLSAVRPFVMLDDLFEQAMRYWAMTGAGNDDQYGTIRDRLGKLLER